MLRYCFVLCIVFDFSWCTSLRLPHLSLLFSFSYLLLLLPHKENEKKRNPFYFPWKGAQRIVISQDPPEDPPKGLKLVLSRPKSTNHLLNLPPPSPNKPRPTAVVVEGHHAGHPLLQLTAAAEKVLVQMSTTVILVKITPPYDTKLYTNLFTKLLQQVFTEMTLWDPFLLKLGI